MKHPIFILMFYIKIKKKVFVGGIHFLCAYLGEIMKEKNILYIENWFVILKFNIISMKKVFTI